MIKLKPSRSITYIPIIFRYHLRTRQRPSFQLFSGDDKKNNNKNNIDFKRHCKSFWHNINARTCNSTMKGHCKYTIYIKHIVRQRVLIKFIIFSSRLFSSIYAYWMSFQLLFYFVYVIHIIYFVVAICILLLNNYTFSAQIKFNI